MQTDNDIEVCPYCYHERGNKQVCCGEVHFVNESDLNAESDNEK